MPNKRLYIIISNKNAYMKINNICIQYIEVSCYLFFPRQFGPIRHRSRSGQVDSVLQLHRLGMALFDQF